MFRSLMRHQDKIGGPARVLALLCVLAPAVPAHAAVLGKLYVNVSSPLFAEIPVCLTHADESLSGYAVEIVGNERFDENNDQPFIRGITYKLDQLNSFEGLLTVNSTLPLPDNLQLIVTLLDSNINQVDSQIYTSFALTGLAPDDFGCAQYQRVTEEIAITPDPPQPKVAKDQPFVIDLVKNDTWRNIATLVNAAWYDNALSVEQVMAVLYQSSMTRLPSIDVQGSSYKLPEQLEIPQHAVAAAINHNAAVALAALLDSSGRFKVERSNQRAMAAQQKRGDIQQQEIANLQNELARLRQQLTAITAQLSDAQSLLEIRSDEAVELLQNLRDTRDQIAELEAVNLELQSPDPGDYLKKALKSHWLWPVVLLIFGVVFILYTISAYQRRRDYISLIRQISRDERLAEKKNSIARH